MNKKMAIIIIAALSLLVCIGAIIFAYRKQITWCWYWIEINYMDLNGEEKLDIFDKYVEEEAVYFLIKILQSKNFEDISGCRAGVTESIPSSLRSNAAAALGKIGDKRAVEPLLQVCEEISDSDRRMIIAVRLNALSALGELGDVRAIDVLLREIGEPSLFMPEDIAGRSLEVLLRKSGNKSINPLLKAFASPNKVVRANAAYYISTLGQPAFEQTCKALQSSNKFVRMAAASALRRFKNEQALEPLKKALTNEKNKDACEAMKVTIKELESLP